MKFNILSVSSKRHSENVSDPGHNYKDKIKELADFLETERVNAGEDLKKNLGGDDSTKEKKSYGTHKGNKDKVHFADDSDDDNNY